jgi:hypothetical protein
VTEKVDWNSIIAQAVAKVTPFVLENQDLLRDWTEDNLRQVILTFQKQGEEAAFDLIVAQMRAADANAGIAANTARLRARRLQATKMNGFIKGLLERVGEAVTGIVIALIPAL